MSCNSFAAVMRVGTDVEVKNTGKSEIAKCRAVHSYSYKENSDVWMGLTFWGQKASAAQKVIKNGDQLFVKGTLQFREYEGKTYVELNVDDFSKIGSSGEKTEKSKKAKKETQTPVVAVEVDAEIPF